MSVEQLGPLSESDVVSNTSAIEALLADVPRRRPRRVRRRPNTAIIALAAQHKIAQRLADQASPPNRETPT